MYFCHPANYSRRVDIFWSRKGVRTYFQTTPRERSIASRRCDKRDSLRRPKFDQGARKCSRIVSFPTEFDLSWLKLLWETYAHTAIYRTHGHWNRYEDVERYKLHFYIIIISTIIRNDFED